MSKDLQIIRDVLLETLTQLKNDAIHRAASSEDVIQKARFMGQAEGYEKIAARLHQAKGSDQ